MAMNLINQLYNKIHMFKMDYVNDMPNEQADWTPEQVSALNLLMSAHLPNSELVYKLHEIADFFHVAHRVQQEMREDMVGDMMNQMGGQEGAEMDGEGDDDDEEDDIMKEMTAWEHVQMEVRFWHLSMMADQLLFRCE